MFPNLLSPIATGVLGAGACVLALGITFSDTVACTPQARTAASEIVQVTIDTCQETPQIVPAGVSGVVGLICSAIDIAGPAVQVLLASDVWEGMKATYLKTHATLPAGMRSPQNDGGAR